MTDNGVRDEPGRGGATARAARFAERLAEKRALNNGSGDALSTAFELALTPTIMGGFGYLVDRWLGTAPIFLIAFVIVTFVYLMWKMFRGYDAVMRQQEADLFRKHQEQGL